MTPAQFSPHANPQNSRKVRVTLKSRPRQKRSLAVGRPSDLDRRARAAMYTLTIEIIE